jgi:hypothetical protein
MKIRILLAGIVAIVMSLGFTAVTFAGPPPRGPLVMVENPFPNAGCGTTWKKVFSGSYNYSPEENYSADRVAVVGSNKNKVKKLASRVENGCDLKFVLMPKQGQGSYRGTSVVCESVDLMRSYNSDVHVACRTSMALSGGELEEGFYSDDLIIWNSGTDVNFSKNRGYIEGPTPTNKHSVSFFIAGWDEGIDWDITVFAKK